MPMEKVQCRGVDVWYKRMKATHRLTRKSETREHPAVCASSEQAIQDGDEVYLLLTNWKLFDNCWVLAREVDAHGWPSVLESVASKFDDFVKRHAEFEPHRRIFGDAPTARARKVQ